MVQILTIVMTVLGLFLSHANAQVQYNQRATLFSGTGSTGAFINLVETYVPDLNAQSFDNKAYSNCVTGSWLFFENSNYNPGNALMEYYFGPNNYCSNFQNLGGRVSSARFAGDPKDYRLDSFTLFVGTYFQGTEEYTVSDLGNLNLDNQASSLIVTGRSPWTVYAQPKFAGDKVCVYPPTSSDYAPAFIYDTNNINIPNRTIRSVRKGCFGQRKVYVQHIASGTVQNITLSAADANVGVFNGLLHASKF